VRLVGLASVADQALVTSAIAQALGVRETGGQPLRDSVIARLQEQHLLLLIDNFEHVLPAAPLLADLLAVCPRLRMLVTSRATLHLRGEHEHAVPPLALPESVAPGRQPASPAALALVPAVALFMQRAQAVKADFALDTANAVPVAAICRRLDGLPLAIELAAARVKLLPPAALLARLERPLSLLTGGARDAPARQRTLHATIDWSYQLLHSVEQALFRRLAVFAGGCTIEAVEAICRVGSELEGDVLDWLGSLVDKSLLQDMPGVDDEPRFGMLETVREYGLEQLAATGEEVVVRDRHLQWCLVVAERAEPELLGAEQDRWLMRLAAEHDNLRVALTWTRESGQEEVGLRLASALCRFWWVRGHLSEGQRRVEDLLAAARSDARATTAREKALCGAGRLAQTQLAFGRAAAHYQESLALARQRDDKGSIARVLTHMGDLAQQQGEYDRASGLYQEAATLYRSTGDTSGLAWTLLGWGDMAADRGEYGQAAAHLEAGLVLFRAQGDTFGLALALDQQGRVALAQGEQEQAAVLFEEQLALCRDLGYHTGMGLALANLGHVARDRGDHDRARAKYEASLAVYEQLEDKRGKARALLGLGDVANAQGDRTRAAACYRDSLALFRRGGPAEVVASVLTTLGRLARECGDLQQAHALFAESLALSRTARTPRGVAVTLEGVAGVALAQGEADRAAYLFGAANALWDLVGGPVDAPLPDREVAGARAALGEDAFGAAWAAGRALPLEEAIALALKGRTEMLPRQ
jgi:predicted ATPase/uncharacterized protein HemY